MSLLYISFLSYSAYSSHFGFTENIAVASCVNNSVFYSFLLFVYLQAITVNGVLPGWYCNFILAGADL